MRDDPECKLCKEIWEPDPTRWDKVLFDMPAEKCGCCGERNGFLFVCDQCSSIEYCSEKCQKKHWRMGHQIDCLTEEKRKALMTIDGVTLDLP
jgi:MYND finger